MRISDPRAPQSAAPVLDASQLDVLAADRGRSMAVIGAPGSGKTTTLLEVYRSTVSEHRFAAHEVLILGANRLVAGRLRRRADQVVSSVTAGQRVRTSSSLALAVLTAARRAEGLPPLRLLTGAVQDELIEASVAAIGVAADAALSEQVVNAASFRNQLRELVRVMDAHGMTPAQLRELGERRGIAEWVQCATIVHRYREHASEAFPLAADTSGMHARAAEVLQSAPLGAAVRATLGDFADLRLVLVDDAQELTDSALMLLRALAQRGVAIWAFGDPDISTGAFHGAAHRALAELGTVLGAPANAPIILSTVYRHGAEIRRTVTTLTNHLGTAGFGPQRRAASERSEPGLVRFAEFAGPSESAGAIAHLLRERHLGLGGGARDLAKPSAGVAWGDMAVLCRTRADARSLARQLAAAEVPTTVAAGGTVLSEHPLVVALLQFTQLVFGWRTVDAHAIGALATGPLGGLDRIALHRFRETAQLADARSGQHRTADEILVAEFEDAFAEPIVDSRQGRAVKRLARTFAAGQRAKDTGGDLSEVLWAVWDASGLATQLERQALSGSGLVAEHAHEALDAALALFFAVRRHEEQDIEVDRRTFVEALLDSDLPEDTLARSDQLEAVRVTTPQGMIGAEARVVVIAQLQDGVWPNLKPRGSLLRLDALNDLLQGREPAPVRDRRDVLHDELRMFVHAVSRASDEVLISAIRNDDTAPSVFFSGLAPATLATLPSSRLTLRGRVAALRRLLNQNPNDDQAAQELAVLAAAGVDGAAPDQWYGIRDVTTHAPLTRADDPDAPVSVSPSRLATFEDCPLNWAISRLGGDSSVPAAAIGTLVHLALERAAEPTFDAIMARIDAGWSLLSFDSVWEQARSRATVTEMAEGVAAYLDDFGREDGTLFGVEEPFEFSVGKARVRGAIDRVEVRSSDGSPARILVVDLKTQRTAPTARELEEHVQLATYQLAVHEGALDLPEGELGGAGLLLVHPQARGTRPYRLAVQEPLTLAQRESLKQRIVDASQGMTAAEFEANVEQHCTDPYAYGRCSLHIIRPVSFG